MKNLRLISIHEVMERTAIRGRAAIYRLVGTGAFPAPVRVSVRRVAWEASSVDRWIAARVAESKANGWRDETATRISTIANAKSVAVRAAQKATHNKPKAKPKRGKRKVQQEAEAA